MAWGLQMRLNGWQLEYEAAGRSAGAAGVYPKRGKFCVWRRLKQHRGQSDDGRIDILCPIHNNALLFPSSSPPRLSPASPLRKTPRAATSTPIPCCTVPASSVPQDDKQTWCNANQNTCVELCGGQGQLASNGNQCDSQTLEFSCDCRNGTDVSDQMDAYQQTVPGLMCRYWYDQCIAATGSDAAAQFQCNQARDNECALPLLLAATAAHPLPAAVPQDSTSEASASAGSSTPTGAAGRIAMYGTPALAGGLFALFGFAL
ncbi:unnamed protein product [Alternaria alternata]